MPELGSRQCPSIRGFSRLGEERSSDLRKHRCYNIVPNTGKLSKLYNIVPNTKYPCENATMIDIETIYSIETVYKVLRDKEYDKNSFDNAF